MENFKFTLFLTFILLLVIFAGYWAFSTIQSGSDHVYIEEIKKLKQENQELKEKLNSLTSQNTEENIDEPILEEEILPEAPKEVSLKHQDLINDLQKLINDNVVLKKGSKGERVGIIQKFLNIYNNTSARIDNDYGAKTIETLKKFEAEQKITISDEIGKNTFQFMVDWLKKQN